MIITYNEKSKKFLKKSLIIISIILIMFIIGLVILKYEVEGENVQEMPFKIGTVTIASKVDAIRNEDAQNFWNLTPIQINDIYIKIDKNENKQEQIVRIQIQDVKIQKNNIGTGKIIPISNNYSAENMESIIYEAKQNSNLENLTVSENGGTIGFRYIIQDLGTFTSNEEEITYSMELLEKMGISRESIKTIINFNLVIELKNGLKYITNISVEVPTKEKNIENIDISNLIFKRLLQN